MRSLDDIHAEMRAADPKVEGLSALAKMIEEQAERRRSGLQAKIAEVLDGLPDEAMVAVSLESAAGDCDSITLSWVLRPLLPGMPIPEGATLYAKPRRTVPTAS